MMGDLLSSTARLRATGKERGVRILSFGIPAYKDETGRMTCPFAGGCSVYCYGHRGSYKWGNVAPKYEERLAATKAANFRERMIDEINRRRPDFLRVHDIGDYYSGRYAMDWIAIAETCPTVRFYSYTTSIALAQSMRWPDNYSITYSMASKQAHLIDPDHDRHVRIFDSMEEMEEQGYRDASQDDLLSTKWAGANLRIGLLWNTQADRRKAAKYHESQR